MNTVLALSGVLSIAIPTLFIILPFSIVTRNHSIKNLSQLVTVNRKIHLCFSCAIFATSISQIIFAVYVINSIRLTYLPVSILIYIFGCLSFTLVGLIRIDKHYDLHTFFAKGYILMTTVSLPLIFFELYGINRGIALYSGALSLLAIIIISADWLMEKRTISIELLHTLFCFLWIVGVYYFL